MRLRRVGNKFSIKTWKFDHIKDPDRRKPIDMDEKVDNMAVSFISVQLLS